MAVFKAVGCQRRGVAPLDGSAQEAEQRADPGLIQVVDKNKRVYGGVPLLGLSWPRAYGRSAVGRSYEASLPPQSRGYLVLLPPPFRSSLPGDRVSSESTICFCWDY